MDLIEFNLLQRFARTGDEEAFAFLVERYGALVLGVCRRQTGDAHLAEDAFQATFLVLARRAGELDAREPLGNWLFGVALRTARQMRMRRDTRNRREREAAAMKHSDEAAPAGKGDAAALEPVIDSALEELPERLRQPLILCALQGRTYEQAATELRISHDTVRGRVAQARERLRAVLARRGVAVPAAVLFSLLGGTADAAVGSGVARATAQAAAQWAKGAALNGPGAAGATDAANHVLREMALRSGMGWGTAAGVALLVGAALIATAKPAPTVAAVPAANAVSPAAQQPEPARAPAAANSTTRVTAPVLVEVPEKARKDDAAGLDFGEGAGNLLQIADVSLEKMDPVDVAEMLSTQFNVNIHFTEAALEALDKPVTLKADGLTGLEILQKLALHTNTELKIEGGRVFLALRKEPKTTAQMPAVAPPKAPEDF